MASYNEDVIFIGKSGGKYTFKAYTMGEECKDESGIYIFAKRTLQASGFGSYLPVYIGRAKSFESRFYNHHKDDCIDENGANAICLMKVPKEEDRVRIENDLLGKYNTKCNEVNN
jgi:hypothetical protein